MTDSPDLVVEFSPNGNTSGMTITARIGNDVLAVDKIDMAKAKQRDAFLDSVCKGRPRINRADVERVLIARAAEHARQHDQADEKSAQPNAQDLLQTTPEHVRQEAQAMLESPDLMKHVIDDVAALGVAGERELIAAIYLVGVSRLLPRPLAAIVQAPSSTGKSYVIDKTAKFFPSEAVIIATSLTPQALFYMEPGSLSHRFIVAGERSRREDSETARQQTRRGR